MAKKLHNIFQESTHPWRRLVAVADNLQHLQAKVATYLPANLKKNCWVATYHKGELVLVSAGGHLATLLRYEAPTLQQKLLKDLPDLVKLTLKIDPALLDPALFASIVPKKVPCVSLLNKAHIHALIEELDHLALKQALLDLIK